MVISKGSYGHGVSKNVLPLLVQIPYLPVQGRKVPLYIGGSIGPRMEICGPSGQPILMVQRLHQSNGYMKRKLRAWRVQKFITLVGADTVLTGGGRKVFRFMGVSIGPRMEICKTSGRPVFMVPRLHQSNGYMKRKLRVWRDRKCIPLVGAITPVNGAGCQNTESRGRQYRAPNGKLRKL